MIPTQCYSILHIGLQKISMYFWFKRGSRVVKEKPNLPWTEPGGKVPI
ncbi:uncharacterized protein PODANS_7_9730 [Podospora anserina S mat+]|uniref:Podospora anserina S mat+ genomic DNA chromosome 7, supercontig 1 n=1 Tax=Podospora anserina (strain S / ATCC MYA-4624 / DSM 980 / FGSC 10383) TaxID=515849 RepID=B2AX92_PODAN|nr:uncharacterized protein PODANS_7_9730 [Podospora anserina S mat+]CAP69016.1 unnamed protein product [Podospora anserina S mat+]CDP32492.1 Putative protein of unknown function [Podospora anserina S mat+]